MMELKLDPSHFTIRISVRRDHAIGKLNVEHDLQKNIEHHWETSELKEGCNLISHFKERTSNPIIKCPYVKAN